MKSCQYFMLMDNVQMQCCSHYKMFIPCIYVGIYRLWNHTDRDDFESRLDTRRRLETDRNEDIVSRTKSRTKQEDLRCPGAACQLSTRHGADCRIRRGIRIGSVGEVQELHRLSVIRIANEPVLVHDQVARCVEGQNDGLGAGRAVEADDRAVAVVELGVGSVEVDAVEDDAGVLELEDKGRERVGALGDGGCL